MKSLELKNRLIENEILFTENIHEALWILEDGSLLDGEYDMGMRGQDHRIIECGLDLDRYDDNFWDVLHSEYNVIRLVPETGFALIGKTQNVNDKQKAILATTDFEIERY